ncbi:glycyl-radical enzyme activating protein [Desulforhopalus singaporensis]|nr:glycyl-radical enzyme activating protein [Desulforhopalus singaporensis]
MDEKIMERAQISREAKRTTAKGIIFEIERWSLSDGPGTRTVVFLKGCPLSCWWCANPESQSDRVQIGVFTGKCIDCDRCAEACDKGLALPAVKGGFSGNGPCRACNRCVSACPSKARRRMGEFVSASEVIKEIKKDSIFYRKSGGGVTFSGGEPFRQPEFLAELLATCKKAGIHTAVETCGLFNWETAADCIDLIDFVMFDLKHMDDRHHRRLTGASNSLVLENAEKMARAGVDMVIRIPIIPSINDSEENIRATAGFVREKLDTALGIEPLPYHRLGLTKYAALGLDYKLSDISSPDDDHIQAICHLITEERVRCFSPGSRYQKESNQSQLTRIK